MKMNKEEKEAKRKLILKEAHNLFVDKGIHQTKMIDISRACGISKGLLYFYFENKDAIAWEIIMQYSNIAYEQARIYIESLRGTGYARLHRALTVIVRSTLKNYSNQTPGYRFREYMFEILAKDSVKEEYIKDYEKDLKNNTELYARLIHEGILDGTIQPNVNSVRVGQTIATALSLYIRHMTALKESGTQAMRIAREDELYTLMDLLLDGLQRYQ